MRIKLIIVLTTLLGIGLGGAQKSFGEIRYEPKWESLDQRKTPDWYSDAKFGIFIHWGLYSVPSWSPVGEYAEWYWNAMTNGKSPKAEKPATWEFHVKQYGADFPYQDFAPMFRAELFDPDHWADVFAQSGAKYIVLTSKHHEGFCLWPNQKASQTWGRPWNSVEIGPKRDLVGDLTKSVRQKGLKMGFYYSLYEWYNPLWLQDRQRFVVEHMHPQFKDLVTRYQPALIFSDGEWDMPSSDWKSEELLAWLFNESPVRDDVVVNDRWGKETRHKNGGYFTTEYGAGMKDATHPWEECRGMGFSFGYNRAETLKDYGAPEELIWMLADLVSRGGNLLLDIGPTADGRIPVIMEERLKQMGTWLSLNGEAIYETRPWRVPHQWSAGKIPESKFGTLMTGYDVTKLIKKTSPDAAVIEAFFTAKGDDVYAITPQWPGSQLILKGITPSATTRITLLGDSAPLKWKASGGDLIIQSPEFQANDPRCQYACVWKLTDIKK